VASTANQRNTTNHRTKSGHTYGWCPTFVCAAHPERACHFPTMNGY
jgi:hypothetical protein